MNKAIELKHKMFHVEHFMFEPGHLVQALIGKDELKYGSLSIQKGAC
ncbi:MAG: hypothetical protein LBI95_02210 [Holosporales bacterium]|nr:hypothetical protein [Holosporales bacterium]